MKEKHVLFAFNKAACSLHLTGRQMQMWMGLYELLELFGGQDRMLYTGLLLKQLKLDKRHFVRVRQGLIDAGFLSIRYDGRQNVYYTLLLQDEPVAMAVVQDREKQQDTAVPMAQKEQPAIYVDGQSADNLPKGFAMLQQPKGDTTLTTVCDGRDIAPLCQLPESSDISKQAVWHSGRQASRKVVREDYTAAIDDFCRMFANANLLKHRLYEWADMRLRNSWQLTLWGLEILLEKLQEIGQGSVDNMVAAVQKSISRRWKGFFSYHTDSKPSGKTLLKEEAEQRRQQERSNAYGRRNGVTQKFKLEGRDLSILER